MIAKLALVGAVARLREAGVEEAASDARALLAYAMQIAPDRLALHTGDDLTKAQEEAFEAAITAREARQPVAQIIGSRLFWGLRFKVTSDTLDPRPETEVLVSKALERPFHKVLDLGTGTGCILLSCLKGMPMAQGVGVDLSPKALAVAQENAENLGLAHRAKFRESNWFSAVSDRFDLIVSNPPYIAEAEMSGLSREVLEWEPHLALTPGGDGLEPYRLIARAAPSRLMAGGRLLLEIGPTQGQAVFGYLRDQGFINIAVLCDFDGRDRVVYGERPTGEGCNA